MPDLTSWLQSLTDQQLREFIDRHLPAMKAAAQAELASRIPTPSAHGTGCPPDCCGAGVRQWR